LIPATESQSAPDDRSASTAEGSHSEMAATHEGEWGSTVSGARIDAGITATGRMAITVIDRLDAFGEPRPPTHPPGMITTGMGLHAGGKGPSASALTPGTLIDGKYRLEAPLGRGGMGSSGGPSTSTCAAASRSSSCSTGSGPSRR
jgi:hypothetical protein